MSENKTTKTTIVAVGVAALLAIAGGTVAVYALIMDVSDEKITQTTEMKHDKSESHTAQAPASSSEASSAVITYGNDGFERTSYAVKSGQTVLVENKSNVEFYFTTGDHHNHNIRSPLNLGTIAPGGSSSFVAPAAGTYTFHNHDNDAEAGELIVQ